MARPSQDAAAGGFLLAIAAFALWQARGLPQGSLTQLGPGMLPRAFALLTGAVGLALLAAALTRPGGRLERWALRGPVFILGAVVAFALSIRPLGLAVAGPLAIVVAAFASDETRWSEVLGFGIVMTAFCIGLFKLLLGLPIPLAPWLLGY